ncbi:MAG: sugar nucleotide-binding protein [Acidobacteria bacterium]|nr:sugar nucleotide-binding protein [Acidobacteriota bacterium]
MAPSKTRPARRRPIRVVEDHIASPTCAPLLAARTADLVERSEQGVYHLGSGTPISWFDFARMVFELAGLKPELRATNEREHRTAARRPRYSALSNTKMEALGLARMPALETAVRGCLAVQARLLAENG